MSAAGIIVCAHCGCGPKGNSPCCACAPGAPNEVVACDPNYVTFPVDAIVEYETYAASMQTEYGNFPLGFTSPVDGTFVSVTDEAGFARWKAEFPVNTFAVDSTVTLVGSDLTIGLDTDWACGNFIYGTLFRIRDAQGNEYEFDTVTGTGLPLPSVDYSLAFAHRHPSETADFTTGGWSGQRRGFLDVQLHHWAGLHYCVSAVASAGTGGEAYVGINTAGSAAGGYTEIFGPVFRSTNEVDYYDVPAHPYETTETTYRYFHAPMPYGLTLPVGPAPGYGLGDSTGASPTGESWKICEGEIAVAPSDPAVVDGDPVEPFATFWGSPYSVNYGLHVRRNSVRKSTTPDATAAVLMRVVEGTIRPVVPADMGCKTCPRWLRVTWKIWGDRPFDDPKDNEPDFLFDGLLRQECLPAATTPGCGWPYKCRWVTHSTFEGSTIPGVTLDRQGPKQWILGPGEIEAGRMKIKHDGGCPPLGECEVMQRVRLRAHETSTSTTYHAGHEPGNGGGNPVQVATYEQHGGSGWTELFYEFYYELTITEASAPEGEELDCACDGEPPACGTCDNCTDCPETVALEPPCPGLGTLVLTKTSSETCGYAGNVDGVGGASISVYEDETGSYFRLYWVGPIIGDEIDAYRPCADGPIGVYDVEYWSSAGSIDCFGETETPTVTVSEESGSLMARSGSSSSGDLIREILNEADGLA